MTRRDTITALQNTQQIKKIFFMEIIKNNITWKATWGILTQQKSSHPNVFFHFVSFKLLSFQSILFKD